jgi:dCMP deaminase
MEVARAISHLSKDPSTKVGALFVDKEGGFLTSGYNGFPRGYDDSLIDTMEREQKYKLVCHAEENGILQSARQGISLKESKVYVCHLPTCIRCAVSLIQAGVKQVVLEETAFSVERWLTDWPATYELYRTCGVEVAVLPKEAI